MEREIEEFFASKNKHLSKVAQKIKQVYRIPNAYVRAAAENLYQDIHENGLEVPGHRLAWEILERAQQLKANKRTKVFVRKFEAEKANLVKLRKERDEARAQRDEALAEISHKKWDRAEIHHRYIAALIATAGVAVTVSYVIWGL